MKSLCAEIVADELDDIAIKERIQKIRHPAVNQAAIEIVPEFVRHLQNGKVEHVPEFKGFRVHYPVGPSPDGGTLNVPVAPTYVCFLNGALTPVFLVPWSKLTFSDFQKLLMSSIIQDALLTHQDFLGCDALVLAFPRIEDARQRYSVAWNVTTYARLDREQLNHQFLTYGRALQKVLDELESEAED